MYKVGAPSFSNTIPLVYPLLNGIIPHDYVFTFSEPTSINKLLDDQRIDIGLISSFHYLLNKEKYRLFSPYGIGTFDEVMSVALFTHRKIEDLHKKTILVPTASATSINLLKILAKFYWEIDIQCREVDMKNLLAYKDSEAFLLIGDVALSFENEFKIPYFDLAKEWHKFSGKKFIFALFATHKKLQACANLFTEKMEESLYWSKNHSDSIVEHIFERLPIPKETIMRYLELLQHRLSDDHFEGLDLFYSYILKMKLSYAL